MRKEIIDGLEKRISFLKGLSNVRLSNMRVRHMNSHLVPVELNSSIFEHIKEGDTLYCDFESNDIWLNTTVNIESPVKSILSQVVFKIPLKAPMSDFKQLM
jgi:hypothetical protein